MFKKDNSAPKAEKPAKEKPVKEKPVKQPKAPEEPKQKKDRHGSKIEHELSELAKDLGIRVSSPYGYYPEDVDPIIAGLQKTVSDLTKENKQLAEDVNDVQSKLKSTQSELSQLKMQMSLMEVPDVSAEEGFAMLSRIDSITGNYNSESVADMKLQQAQQQPQAPAKPKINIKLPKQQ
jgi:hypothetical protein